MKDFNWDISMGNIMKDLGGFSKKGSDSLIGEEEITG